MEDLFVLFEKFLRAERGYSPNTLEAYLRDVKSFSVYTGLPSSRMGQASKSQVRKWLAHCQKAGAKRSTLNRKLASLRTFFKFLIREGLAELNPAAGIKTAGLDKSLPSYLSVDQAFSLLGNSGEGFKEVRDRAILELLYSAGLRVGELTGLDLEQVDFDPEMVKVKGKGNKERIVPFGTEARKALLSYLPYREQVLEKRGAKDEPALFINRLGSRLSARSVQRMVAKQAIKAGIVKKVTPHTLRHAMASHMLESGADLKTIQDILGHASLSTTQIYTHLDMTGLSAIYDKAHPRARKKGT